MGQPVNRAFSLTRIIGGIIIGVTLVSGMVHFSLDPAQRAPGISDTEAAAYLAALLVVGGILLMRRCKRTEQ